MIFQELNKLFYAKLRNKNSEISMIEKLKFY